MAAKEIMIFLASSFIVHLLLLYVPQDFHCTLIDMKGDEPIEPRKHSLTPSAKRVVIFTIQDLTAHALYHSVSEVDTDVQFLRRLIASQGRWGIAYSKSIPGSTGHAPLVTGTSKGYLKQGKFDNILEAAVHTWVWSDAGSWLGLRNFSEKMSANLKDENTSGFQWMFESSEELFLIKGNEEITHRQLSQDNVIFYYNIRFPQTHQDIVSMNDAVRNITNLFDSYYSDGKTTFIFTAIHSNVNTTTNNKTLMLPFISWGAGIKRPKSKRHSTLINNDDLSEVWQLDHLERLDIKQIDIAPLVSTMLGMRIPIHSRGILPVDYIHYNKQFFAESCYINSLQLLELFKAFEKSVADHSLPFSFRPYAKLSPSQQQTFKQNIAGLIENRKLQEALTMSQNLMKLCNEGIDYYIAYHHLSLKVTITLGIIGWIIYLVMTLATDNRESIAKSKSEQVLCFHSCLSIIVCVLVAIMVVYQDMPVHFIAYFCFPIACFDRVFCNRLILYHTIQESMLQPDNFCKQFVYVVSFIVGIELIIASFYEKHILISIYLLLSLAPYLPQFDRQYLYSSLSWTVSCIIMAGYLLCQASFSAIPFSNIIAVTITICFVSYLLIIPSCAYSFFPHSKHIMIIKLLELTIVCISVDIIDFMSIKWLVLLASLFSLLVLPQTVYGRLIYLSLEFLILLILLSGPAVMERDVSTFFITCCFLLLSWLSLEEKAIHHIKSLSDGLVCYSQDVDILPITSTGIVPSTKRVMFVCIFCATIFHYFTNATIVSSDGLLDARSLLSSLLSSIAGSHLLTTIRLSLLITFISCNYNILSSALRVTFKTNLTLFTIFCDVVALHFFVLMQSSVPFESDAYLVSFLLSLVMATSIPLMLFLAHLMTGCNIVPRKSDEMKN
jgi:hypothetical protein